MAGHKRRCIDKGSNTTGGNPSRVPPTFLSTFDHGFHYPIFAVLCDCLKIAEIIALSQTCKKLSGLYRYLLSTQWNIDKELSRYVDDAPGFRSEMAKCGALIDGIFAFEFFERSAWTCNSLRVTIQQDVELGPFCKYLSDTAGYSKVDTGRFEEDEVLDGDYKVSTFKRDSDSTLTIFLRLSKCPPVQLILWDASTTAESNIISWNKAYAPFPLPTFIHNKGYLLQEYDERTEQAVRTQSDPDGLDIQGVMWPEDRRLNHPIRQRRRLGDHHTWTIPFDTAGIEVSKTPDYVLEHACFTMDLDAEFDDDKMNRVQQERIRQYTIEMATLESKVLKHTYVCSVDDMKTFFSRRLLSFTLFELRKLDPAQRPTNYDEILRNPGDIDRLLGDFERPASWRYRDEEIPRWYQAFEKYKPA